MREVIEEETVNDMKKDYSKIDEKEAGFHYGVTLRELCEGVGKYADYKITKFTDHGGKHFTITVEKEI